MTCRYPYCDAGGLGAFCKEECQTAHECTHGVDDVGTGKRPYPFKLLTEEEAAYLSAMRGANE